MIVVDQMRADYVDDFQARWTGGLKRMVTAGAWFRRAAYPYLTTVTCPGHATIATGAYPPRHGVFQNTWFSRARNALVACTDDPAVTGIAYGRGRAGTHSPVNLKVPTFADEMRLQRNAHVVSMSLKPRSAIMLAGHGGDSVTWLSALSDGWETSTAYTTAPVAATKAFIDANPIDADFGRAWSLMLPEEKYRNSDVGLREAAPAGWTSTFPHVLNGMPSSGADAAYYAQWERSPYADAYLGRMATSLVESLQLGKHAGTDVLAVSFSTPDLVGHAFGPRSREVEDLYLHLDRTLGTLFQALDRLVGPNRWVAALTSDHGVSEIPEQRLAAGRDGGRLDSQAIVIAVDQQIRRGLDGAQAPAVIRMVGNDIYLRPGVFDQLVAKPSVLNDALTAAMARPGVGRAFGANHLAPGSPSKDPLLRSAALSYVPGASGDIVIVPKVGWMIASTGTTHGTANIDDQRVPMLFFGKGIKAGRYDDVASPADLAPTLAALLGITMPQAQGTALTSALENLRSAPARAK